MTPARSAASATEAVLYLPWAFLEKQMATLGGLDGRPWSQEIPGTSVSVAGYDLGLFNIRWQAVALANPPRFDGESLSVHLPRISARIHVGELRIDQLIERRVGGTLVRVRLKAQCGPLVLAQDGAAAEGRLQVQWIEGRPTASLTEIDLQWDPSSWRMGDFHCSGPQGFAEIVETELKEAFQNPETLRPSIEDFVAAQIQKGAAEMLKALALPLPVGEDGKTWLKIGALAPAKTGLLSALHVAASPDEQASTEPPAWDEEQLAKLPQDRPSALAKLPSLIRLFQSEIAKRPETLSLALHEVPAFRSLMRSRFLQLFVWPDLWNYPKDSAFYLRFKAPENLSPSWKGGALSARLNLQAVLQSKRGGKWWNYVNVSAGASAKIKLSIKQGLMKFSTELADPKVSAASTSEYRRRFGSGGWILASPFASALEGPLPALSGEWSWPEIALGESFGTYQAQELRWMDSETAVIPWSLKNSK